MKKLTTAEAACIVAGNGIGGGLMALPYLAQYAGWLGTLLVLCFSYFVTIVLHFMLADMLLAAKNGSGILSIFSEFLFRGRLKMLLTEGFFVLLLITLLFNISAYIAGGADIICDVTGMPPVLSKIVLYAVVVIVPILGLKALGLSEKMTVLVMVAAVAALAAISLLNGKPALHGLPVVPVFPVNAKAIVALYGLAMFSFSALFSVPQVVDGLERNPRAVKTSIILGVAINLLMSLVICFSVLYTSPVVTEVAIIGWSAALGTPVKLIGSLVVLGAMVTSYWAISLALSDMVCEQFSVKRLKGLIYLLSTFPCLMLALFNKASFMSFIGVAGGVVAIIIALLLLPAYRNAYQESNNKDVWITAYSLRGSVWLTLFIGACYILMAIGSMLAV